MLAAVGIQKVSGHFECQERNTRTSDGGWGLALGLVLALALRLASVGALGVILLLAPLLGRVVVAVLVLVVLDVGLGLLDDVRVLGDDFGVPLNLRLDEARASRLKLVAAVNLEVREAATRVSRRIREGHTDEVDVEQEHERLGSSGGSVELSRAWKAESARPA